MQNTTFLQRIDTKKLISKLIIFLAFLSLCSCATDPGIEISSKNTHIDNNKISTLDKWQASGVLSVVSNNNADNARFYWENIGNDFDITLKGTFGIGTIKIKANNNVATIIDQNGHITKSKNINNSLKNQIGIDIPINDMKNWFKGLSSTDDEDAKFYKNSLLKETSNNGWQARFSQYENVDGYVLPTNILINNKQLNTRVKVVVKKWQIK